MRLSIFPLPGAILFPGLQLPLHIFEERYRSMTSDALARDRKIAMIQPKRGGDNAPLYEVGCIGRIDDVEAMEDGRFNLLLQGQTRFRLVRELDVATAFRQIEAEVIEDDDTIPLAAVERAGLEQEARRFAETQGYSVDWDSVERLDDYSLVNGVAQIAPFDVASKQALLEADSISARCDMLVQLMQFFSLRDGGDDKVTLQ
jgi:Lon protease-like protein